MEHIRQYDWCTFQPDTPYFVTESELDNCVTEKILRNKFSNPLISSDSEEEGKAPKIDWNFVFNKRNNEHNIHRIFVPGLRPLLAYTRLSTLSSQQHLIGLKVLCAQNPHILEDEFMAKPNKFDLQAFESIKEILQKEQKEYIDWAKSLWTNGQCIRALRPKPLIESVYEAEFKVRANQMKGYPRMFELVAQIPMEPAGEYDMVMEKELIGVNPSELLKVERPLNIRSRLTVMRPSAVPEPCDQHPVRFILPHEKSISVLPVTEVYRTLAEYAIDNGALFVASEGALRCMVERRAWALPISVYSVTQPGQAENVNVTVLGSEFMNKQENVMRRTFRALRHLLEIALVPASELARRTQAPEEEIVQETTTSSQDVAWSDDTSDEEDNLFIDFDEASTKERDADKPRPPSKNADEQTKMEVDKCTPQKETKNTTNTNKSFTEGFGVYKCTCQDSIFERPPPRSFRKWRFRKKSTFESFDVIVHCAHKFKGSRGEVILEPIAEYQADMGASKQSEDRISSVALSLALRDDNTNVLNVRLDAESGDIITTEEHTRSQFYSEHGDRSQQAAGVIHAALSQLEGLVPGHYVLQHEPNHGLNALLYAPSNTGKEGLKLEFDSTQPAEADEAKTVKAPPQLIPALLPWHKLRKILPCTFTYYQNQLAKPKKQPPRKKTPPRALKWPKKRGGHKKAE
ncbi:uncharacterized protein LOC125228557 isoform X2 [Leguminivora glycinivorella]|uniref:uncharacterized protein LOC125228557 isoform X2 n=1 Tax=Leguminivora glycinivorella TaxID=1035111 RepID=UPI0020105A58|nr:uncharacterized protein LOC125228557 isoform X2 [Leguminivora glycinivorella]